MADLLRMIGITKQFPGVLANDGVDFEVRKGEVHALLGENGAGKSTLMSILYGLYTPTSGQIYFRGKPVEIKTPRVAIDLGIGMVHQHFMLIPALTVVENIILGMPQEREPLLDLRNSAKKITELSKRYGLNLDPFAKVWQLSVGEQQRAEIIKALFRGADLLILDEPTAVLTPQETEELFRMIRQLTAEGHSVIFISHKLNEVMAISDRVTVLRAGQSAGTVEAKNTNQADLARMMVGRDVLFRVRKDPAKSGGKVLEVQGMNAVNKRGLRALKDVSLEVRAGEVLGIAGVDGNGQSELIEAIAGLLKVTGGKVVVNGREITNAHPRKILENRISHIPEDRHVRGLVMSMTLKENFMLQTYYRAPFTRGLFLDWDKIGHQARELIRQYDVKTTGEDAYARHLSGGNQQKVILARELCREPDLLLAMHPTRGLDIGATEFIHQKIIVERDRGCAVLLVSTELEEIFSLSDRIAVMFEGEIMGILQAAEAGVQEIGLMMAGSKRIAG